MVNRVDITDAARAGIDRLREEHGELMFHQSMKAPGIDQVEQHARAARHGLPLGRYRTLGMPVSVTTSRGCPFQCVFCAGRRMVGARVRFDHIGRLPELVGLAAEAR